MDSVQHPTARSARGAEGWSSVRSRHSLKPIVVLAALLPLLPVGRLCAQSQTMTISKSFSPPIVALSGTSIGTITVTNPNAFPVTTVQFSDTMPAGIQLVTQTGGTCSTLATGGGIFSINPGAGTFSSTSNVLAGGQSCTITVQVSGTVIGVHVNTTSQVTATGAPSGGPASATLTVGDAPSVPAIGSFGLALLASLLAAGGVLAIRRFS